MHGLIRAARRRGLYVHATLADGVYVVSTSRSGYAVFRGEYLIGSIAELMMMMEGDDA